MTQTNFEELNLSNAFLFAAALEDEEICQLVLEMILGRPVSRVKVHIEHTILYNSKYRSIRLDVYATDEVLVGYNLEMQNKDEHNLPKRSRFHQAEIDVAALNPGDDFSDLKPSYIIFICTFDPFGLGLYRYTFEKRCLEADFSLGDETYTIFLNTKGSNDEKAPKELVEFLKYVENGEDSATGGIKDGGVEKLHKKICKLKKSRRWRESYMTLGEYIDDVVEDRVAEVLENAVEENTLKTTEKVETMMLDLIRAMVDAGDAALLPKLGESKEFLREMYAKYHIGSEDVK